MTTPSAMGRVGRTKGEGPATGAMITPPTSSALANKRARRNLPPASAVVVWRRSPHDLDHNNNDARGEPRLSDVEDVGATLTPARHYMIGRSAHATTTADSAIITSPRRGTFGGVKPPPKSARKRNESYATRTFGDLDDDDEDDEEEENNGDSAAGNAEDARRRGEGGPAVPRERSVLRQWIQTESCCTTSVSVSPMLATTDSRETHSSPARSTTRRAAAARDERLIHLLESIENGSSSITTTFISLPPPTSPPRNPSAAPPDDDPTAFMFAALEAAERSAIKRRKQMSLERTPLRPLQSPSRGGFHHWLTGSSFREEPAIPSRSATCALEGSRWGRFRVISSTPGPEEGSLDVTLRPLLLTRLAPGDPRLSPSAVRPEVLLRLSPEWASATPLACLAPNEVIHVVLSPGYRAEENLRDMRTIHLAPECNFLVVRPDTLVSPTRIADANSCVRRSVLAEVASSSSSASVATVMGNVKHRLFEGALRVPSRFAGRDAMLRACGSLAQSDAVAEELFAAGLSREDCAGELEACADEMCAWGTNFLSPAPGVAPVVSLGGEAEMRMRVCRVIATEEMVWSPMWGLKGALDASVVLGVSPTATLSEPPPTEVKIVAPLELKTGKSLRVEHRAQVLFYSLLMADRYYASAFPSSPLGGVLVHAPTMEALNGLTKGGPITVSAVKVTHHEVRQLVMLRNRLVAGTTARKEASKRFDKKRKRADENNETSCNSDELDRGIVSEDRESEEEMEEDETEEPPQALPPVIGNVAGECDRCFHRETCALHHAAVEGGTHATMGMDEDAFTSLVGHLLPIHLAYYARWMRMLALEDTQSRDSQAELWTRTGAEREEATGRCVTGLRKLSTVKCSSSSTTPLVMSAATPMKAEIEEFEEIEEGYYLHEFTRAGGGGGVDTPPESHNGKNNHVDAIAWPELQFEVSDAVAVSLEGAHHALERGYVAGGTRSTLRVRTRNLLPPGREEGPWRIDRLEFASATRLLQENVAGVLARERRRGGTGDDARLRSLVVENAAPCFWDEGEVGKRWVREAVPAHFAALLRLVGSPEELRHGLRAPWDDNLRARLHSRAEGMSDFARSREPLARAFEALAPDQQAAVCHAMAAKDYALVMGVPGSGKTTAIVFLVRLLRALGRSVLLTSYTHGALDNLVIRLRAQGVPVLRLGSVGGASGASGGESAEEVGSLSPTDYEGWAAKEDLVVAATCLGTKHAFFRRRRFDYVVVDEAGQLVEPAVLGPLRCADVAVMVGDPKQLSPLVVSERARKEGMDISLMERLAKLHPSSLTVLRAQFRMNAELTALANEVVYEGILVCGDRVTAERRLHLPSFDRVFPPADSTLRESWLFRALDPSRPVVFLDTDCCGPNGEPALEELESARRGGGVASVLTSSSSSSPESGGGGLVVNEIEAAVARIVVERLARCGVPLAEVGVISPYRAQLRALRRRLFPAVEVDTVDRFQGRDKACVVVSMVRSNNENKAGMLLADWRRLNVAITRAKCKLIVMGSRATLRSSPVCERLLKCVSEKDWVVVIPPGGVEAFRGKGEGGPR